MSMEWIHEEQPSHWDADKARVVAGAEPGIFDVRFGRVAEGEVIPGEWWRVVEDGRTLGFCWLDVVWGDAEILLAVDREARGRGVGSFMLDRLEHEAKRRGLNHLYNSVRPTHPDRDRVTAWLSKRGFRPNEDGSLFQALVPADA